MDDSDLEKDERTTDDTTLTQRVNVKYLDCMFTSDESMRVIVEEEGTLDVLP